MHKRLFIVLVLIFISVSGFTQFYNGHQMSFGKSRVQYRDFFWNYYRFEKYDIYFYDKGDKLAKYTNTFAEKKLKETEILFGHALQKRIIFIVYNRQSEFKQSNIGLVTGNEEYNTGGVMKIIDNKVFLYFEGDHKKFEQQISKVISEVIFTEMIYGGNIREKLASSTLLNIPDWYSKGLFSYLSRDWDFEIEDKVKDGILNGRYKKFSKLNERDAVYAGHSFWRYIAEVYGRTVIPNIIYMTKVNKNPESGFLFVLGMSLKEITPDWIAFYQTRFSADTVSKGRDEEYKKIVRWPRKKKVYENVKISPDNRFIAYSTNELGKYKIYLYDIEKGRKKRIFKRGHKLDQEIDHSFPALGWHPKSNILSFVTEDKGHLYLNNYYIDSKKTKNRILPFEKVLSIDYSHDGYKIALSGVKKGLTDIYVFSVTAGTTEQITKDLADDFTPKFADRSGKIVFTSNRINDTIRFEKYIHAPVDNTFDLFVYDYRNKSKVLTRVTKSQYDNESQPVELAKNIYSYISDENGVLNRYIARYDSTVNYVDTAVHYRYFANSYPLTNYKNNILEHDVNPRNRSFVEIQYEKGKNQLKFDTLKTKRNSYMGEFTNTQFRNILTKTIIKEDSLQIIKKQKKLEEKKKIAKEAKQQKQKIVIPPPKVNPDSMIIDIRNYIFEREKYSDYYNNLALKQQKADKKIDKPKFPKKESYQTNFYVNQIVNQVDFGFLNTSYQAFTGQATYFNPGFNVLFKIGTNDLFEDYKIIAGFRLAGNFDSNEFLLSWENLKGRWDKQTIYHRQVYRNTVLGYQTAKTTTQEFMQMYKFPFTQVSAVRFTGSFRHDQITKLSVNMPTLEEGDVFRNWASLKTEYIFDNTRSLGVNLNEGTRAKVWGEYYKEIGDSESDMYVLGVDFRHYIPIHRTIIFATRFAAGTSFGKSRLIYYLGGVDNWISYGAGDDMFDDSVEENKDIDWKFQTVGTNMRGFPQNVRNGSSFMVMNNEIRLPVFRYIANRPINSDFFNNFQVVGFADVGTAFCGISPTSDENAYNTKVLENNPITVTIDLRKSPFVGGVGFGLRSRLFGYFVRTDWAWGIENGQILDRIFYLSLSLDF